MFNDIGKYGVVFTDEFKYNFAWMDWLKLNNLIECLKLEGNISHATNETLIELLGKFKPNFEEDK